MEPSWLSRQMRAGTPATPDVNLTSLVTSGNAAARISPQPEYPRTQDVGSAYQLASSAGPAEAPVGCQFPSSLPLPASKTCKIAGAAQESFATYVVSPVQSVS